ncbi:MAG: hypothetical protein OXL36_15080 [Bryobacterales bacterium]|nr:hypothetical protein [Bryobacterales bacterium]
MSTRLDKRDVSGHWLACISDHPTVEARHTTARTSQRLLAMLNVLFKYACARLFPPPGLRLVLTALSRSSPRSVMRNAGEWEFATLVRNRCQDGTAPDSTMNT